MDQYSHVVQAPLQTTHLVGSLDYIARPDNNLTDFINTLTGRFQVCGSVMIAQGRAYIAIEPPNTNAKNRNTVIEGILGLGVIDYEFHEGMMKNYGAAYDCISVNESELRQALIEPKILRQLIENKINAVLKAVDCDVIQGLEVTYSSNVTVLTFKYTDRDKPLPPISERREFYDEWLEKNERNICEATNILSGLFKRYLTPIPMEVTIDHKNMYADIDTVKLLKVLKIDPDRAVDLHR